MKNKRILITGGGGFIGSWLVEEWFKDNKITIFDNGRRNAFKFLSDRIQKKVTVIDGDIRNLEEVDKALDNQNILVHLAAIAGASFYDKDPLLTLDVNLFGTANLLRAVSGKKLERIVTFSTSEVYGPMAVEVGEDDPTCIGPISEGRWSYSVSKLASDHLARALFKKNNLPISIIRPFNIYGPRQVGEGAISNMFISALKEKKIYVSGDGSQKRAWCYASDLVTAVESICKTSFFGECFNIGNPNAHISIIDLAKKIQTLCNGVMIVFTEKRTVEVLDRKPSIKKSEKLLKYSPEVGLDEGLRSTFDWWAKNIAKF